MKKIILGLLLTLSLSAAADQCLLIPKRIAQKAVKVISTNNIIKNYCQICGDEKPELIYIRSLAYKQSNVKNLYEVTVNGKPIDLAYTYVQNTNLSKIVGCPSENVSDSLY